MIDKFLILIGLSGFLEGGLVTILFIYLDVNFVSYFVFFSFVQVYSTLRTLALLKFCGYLS
jgi:hypothetical protein